MFFSGYNNKDYWQSFPTVTIAKVKINFNSQSKKYMFDTTIDNIRHKIAKIVSFFIINYTRRPLPHSQSAQFQSLHCLTHRLFACLFHGECASVFICNIHILYYIEMYCFNASTYSTKALRPLSVIRAVVRVLFPTNPFSTEIYPAKESLSSCTLRFPAVDSVFSLR